MADDDNDNDDEEEQNQNSIKVILVGDSGTGKTNLIGVATGQQFNAATLTTTTCSYMRIVIKINDIEYKVNLWDTIGQEKYKSMTKIFFKNSKIVLYVYDVTKRETFDSLKNWKNTIDEILGDVPTVGVVANKCDLYLEEQVKENEGKQYADEIGAKFIYTSAKLDAINFKAFIEEMVKEYVNKFEIKKNNEIIIDKKNHKKKENKNDRKKCC